MTKEAPSKRRFQIFKRPRANPNVRTGMVTAGGIHYEPIGTRVSQPTLQGLAAAVADGHARSRSKLVERAINDYLKRNGYRQEALP